ncbi:MAG: hypothetical protein LBR79_07110 [Oscillospiraceae bacterium]|nr:hypothetical protein [Oscillospiraceae bacterium]
MRKKEKVPIILRHNPKNIVNGGTIMWTFKPLCILLVFIFYTLTIIKP